jgi:membrane-associated phospholipid phosphatase
MSIETTLVTSLNSWGEQHRSLIRVFSNDFVYLVLALSALWFLVRILRAYPLKSGLKQLIVNLVSKGGFILVLPVGISILISESISKLYVRQRPFVAIPGIKLLVPHSADGGMPSHHIVFMVTLVATIYLYQRRFSFILGLLTLLSGVARVIAGIHYPSDIIVGVALGLAIAYLYRWTVIKLAHRDLLLLD